MTIHGAAGAATTSSESANPSTCVRNAGADSPDHAPCDTVVFRPGSGSGERCGRILVPTTGGPHASVALRLARSLAVEADRRVDALFVQPHVGYDA